MGYKLLVTSRKLMLKLHNTLTGKKENFKPISQTVGMYNCGPTVYNYAHIGNLRAYVFADILRRTLEWNGYKVRQIVNITDIGHLTSDTDEGEDKMIKALKREGKPMTLEAMREIGAFYRDAFVADLKALNIKLPEEMPRASDNIAEDIEIIKKLEEKAVAYKISDGLYFDISKFPNYGKLGNIKRENLKEGARVEVNPEKKSPVDFNLWKFNDDLGWDSPWGKGFPGWHIECSAMSKKYLGQPFDIHTGGIDHIGTHHNNEIAQSEAAFGAPLANYWMHNEHLNMAGGKKMAKSDDNFLTLNYLLEKNITPLACRYYFLNTHYRKPMLFSEEALDSAATALARLAASLAAMPEGGKVNTEYEKRFSETLSDDLNTTDGLAILWELMRDKKVSPAGKRATALKFDEILGLDLKKLIEQESASVSIPPAVARLIKERETARADKNWSRADELREEIKKLGFEIKDTETRQKILKKP